MIPHNASGGGRRAGELSKGLFCPEGWGGCIVIWVVGCPSAIIHPCRSASMDHELSAMVDAMGR
jgi:hypothetical protein